MNIVTVLFEATPSSATIRKVVQYLQFNGEDVDQRQAVEALQNVAHLTGSVTIFRLMRLEPDVVSKIHPHTNLGVYWSETSKIPRDNLLADQKGIWFLFEARVDARSIDIVETAGARLLNSITEEWEAEHEVRLLRGKPLILVSITDDSGKTYGQRLSGSAFVA